MPSEKFMRHHYGASGLKTQPKKKSELERTTEVLGTLISWMANSANSPISYAEATRLLRMLAGEK